MTIPELESYVTQLLPDLRRKYVHSDDDEDCCQRALIDLAKKCDKYPINSEGEFTKLFLSFYNTVKFGERVAAARVFKSGYTTHRLLQPDSSAFESSDASESEHDNINTNNQSSGRFDQWHEPEVDPWNTPTTMVMEWIELLPKERMQQVFIYYYIEGYTLKEVAELIGVSKTRIEQILSEGITHLRNYLLEQYYEGEVT